MNASGQVTGRASTADPTAGEFHAFLWDGTTLRDLGTLGGESSLGLAINAAGQVTGQANTAEGAFHAFLWDGTTMLDLGTLGGESSDGRDLNESSQVTGSADTADGASHAFLWDGTTMLDLGTLGGTFSQGVAINALGQVIGVASTSNGGLRPFLSDGGATLQDLDALIDPADPLASFVTLFAAVDINDLGQILANGFDSRSSEGHAYVLTPVSVAESGTLALLGLGLAGLGLTRRMPLQTTLGQ
jgi:probable HAF family extracellular repeat protein